MKTTIITCLIGLCSVLAFGQKNTLIGTVNDAKGNPVPYAFIKDAVNNFGTYTDSFGNFTLKVDNVDRIIVTAANFKPNTVKITDPQKIMVALVPDGTASNITIDPETFKEKLSNEGMTRNVASGYIAHENTLHGSRYLFDHWVHGYIIAANDSIQQSSNNLYNYDKMEGSLLVTIDGKKMQAATKDGIKQFTLVDDGIYVFEDVPAIDNKHYVQVLSAGSKYKIYKKLGTKFFPNDYVSNGMTSTGHNYDEIKDEPEYYVVKVPGGSPQKIALKSKALKTVFTAEGAKVNKYLSDHDTDIDDAYLTALGDYLNN